MRDTRRELKRTRKRSLTPAVVINLRATGRTARADSCIPRPTGALAMSPVEAVNDIMIEGTDVDDGQELVTADAVYTAQ